MAKIRKKLRWYYIVPGIILLLLLLVLAASSLVEYKIKKSICNSIQTALFVQVEIQDVDIRWFKGEIQIDGLVISGKNHFENQKMLSCDFLSVSIDKSEKLSFNNVALDEIIVDNAEIYILTNENGQNCWELQSESSTDKNGTEIGKLSLNHLKINNLSIQASSKADSSFYALKNLSFQLESKTSGENLSYFFHMIAPEIQLKNSEIDIKIPRIEFQTEILTDSTFKNITYSGNLRLNQWFTTISGYYKHSDTLPEFMFTWQTPECSIKDVVSVFSNTAVVDSLLVYSGTFSSDVSVVCNTKTKNRTIVEAGLSIGNAEIRNAINGKFIACSAQLDFGYNRLKYGSSLYHNDSISFYSYSDTLLVSLISNLSDGSNISNLFTKGSFDFSQVNDVLMSDKYLLGGVVHAGNINTPKLSQSLAFENLCISGNNASGNLFAASGTVSAKENDYNFNSIISSGEKIVLDISASLRTTDEINISGPAKFTAQIKIPKINVPIGATPAIVMPEALQKKTFAKPNMGIPYSENIITDISLQIDSVYLSNNYAGSFIANYFADLKQFRCEFKLENDDMSEIDLRIQIDATSFSSNSIKVFSKAQFSGTTGDSAYTGNLQWLADINASIDNSLQVIDKSINGKLTLKSDSIFIDKEIITKRFALLSGIIQSDLLKIKKVNFDCVISNSVFTFKDCSASIDKWKIVTDGFFKQEKDISFKTKIVVNPNDLSFIEKQYIKKAAKNNNNDLDNLLNADYIIINIITEGEISEPSNKFEFKAVYLK